MYCLQNTKYTTKQYTGKRVQCYYFSKMGKNRMEKVMKSRGDFEFLFFFHFLNLNAIS